MAVLAATRVALGPSHLHCVHQFPYVLHDKVGLDSFSGFFKVQESVNYYSSSYLGFPLPWINSEELEALKDAFPLNRIYLPGSECK